MSNYSGIDISIKGCDGGFQGWINLSRPLTSEERTHVIATWGDRSNIAYIGMFHFVCPDANALVEKIREVIAGAQVSQKKDKNELSHEMSEAPNAH